MVPVSLGHSGYLLRLGVELEALPCCTVSSSLFLPWHRPLFPLFFPLQPNTACSSSDPSLVGFPVTACRLLGLILCIHGVSSVFLPKKEKLRTLIYIMSQVDRSNGSLLHPNGKAWVNPRWQSLLLERSTYPLTYKASLPSSCNCHSDSPWCHHEWRLLSPVPPAV